MPTRRPSPACALRQLASTQQALASVRALEVTDWRHRASKAQALTRLEALERKWRRVLSRVDGYAVPF